jgi:hypothetical protein
MRSRPWLGILIVSSLLCAGVALPAAGDGAPPNEPGLLVRFRPEVSREAAAEILGRQGAARFAPLQRVTGKTPTPMDRWWVVRFAPGSNLDQAAAALRAEAAVDLVEVDGTVRVPQ